MDNRGKRSIVLDLQREEGRAIGLELIARADVFVTNVRPAALARLGLDAASLCERFPRLIYALITGYGSAGPDSERAAYDIAAFWARSGIAAMLSQPNQHPPFQRGGMGDHGAGLSLAAAVCAGLYARERTGRGQVVETSLLRQGVYTLSFDLAIALRYGQSAGLANRSAMPNPAINCYRDSDGRWLWLVGLEGERHWPPLARAVGHPEWIEDARFATPLARAQNARTLIAELDAIFATRTRAEWGRAFEAEPDLWWAPVQNLEEVLADPQVQAAGGLVAVPDGEGSTLLPNTPCDFRGTPGAARGMAPAHGADTDSVLGELGRSPAEIAKLRASGLLG
jgi:crotonobetainyl-CoA:carnitine CoA-transferase CaiB-like acyl-CoA transferase